MNFVTIIRFLFGERRAIFEVATSRSAVWLGFLFVISAGFAREYDGEDLLHEPWHLLIPLVASLATSFILFLMFWLCLWRKSTEADPLRSFLASYRSFLGLYWMTAPLAWLYAIPVEQYMSAGDATQFNLCLLGIVAAWRVLLMIRIGSVVFGAPVTQAIGLVMLFAVSVTFAILTLTPIPVVSVMGGIRLTESEEVIQVTSLLVGAFCILSFPIWLTCSLVVLGRKGPDWRLAPSVELERKVSPLTWAGGVFSLAIWILVLPSFQGEQQLRRQVERNLVNGRIEEALQTMSSRQRSDFPAHWDPPPRPAYRESLPHILDVVEQSIDSQRNDWVQEVYVDKLADSGLFTPWAPPLFEESGRLDQLLRVIEQRPDLIESFKWPLERQINENATSTPEQQDRIKSLLGLDEDASRKDEGNEPAAQP